MNTKKKCSSCGLQFPSELISRINGKNYCEKCAIKVKKDSEDLKQLKDAINLYIKPHKSLWPLIMKQVKQYKEEYGFKYKGMKYTLDYLFIYSENFELDNDLEDRGIAFLPYWYNKAMNFFSKYWELKSTEEEKIEKAFNMPKNSVILNRSDLIKRDEEYEEKIKKLQHRELMSLDDVEDDGIIVNDFDLFK